MSRQLLEGEREIRVVRQHWSVFLEVVGIGLLALVVGFVILAVTPGSVSGRSLRTVKVGIGVALVVVALGAFLVRYTRWRLTTFTLTDHRVVVARGVLGRYSESISLDRVQDTSVTQGLLARIFHSGNVEIESAGRDGNEVLRHINDPQRFSIELQQAIEARRRGVTYGQPQSPQGYTGGGYTPPGGTPGGGYAPPPGYTPHDGT